MGTEPLEDFGGDFGAAGFGERIEGLEPLLDFEVVESVRHGNVRAIIGGCAGVYGELVVLGSCLVVHDVRLVSIHSIGLRHGVSRTALKFISLISRIEYTSARKSARKD